MILSVLVVAWKGLNCRLKGFELSLQRVWTVASKSLRSERSAINVKGVQLGGEDQRAKQDYASPLTTVSSAPGEP